MDTGRWFLGISLALCLGTPLRGQEEGLDTLRPVMPLADPPALVDLDSALPGSAALRPAPSDSLTAFRLKVLDDRTSFPLVYNHHVKNYIDLYTKKRVVLINRVLGRSAYYFPLIDKIFAKHGVPLELKYLAVIESALDPRAQSPAGAKGLWQFMYSTAKMKGLEINSYIDERADPIKSTEAAAKYLKELYRIFGDWHLVLAAYNSGPGNVAKAIQRSGGIRDYWALRPYLPKTTSGYVPGFIALVYVMEYAQDLQLTATEPPFRYDQLDTVDIKKGVSFAVLSKTLEVDEEILADLNPAYRFRQIPTPQPGGHAYHIVLPRNAAQLFVALEDSIYALEPMAIAVPAAPKPAAPKSATVTHTVRSGDTLSAIGRKYGVSVRDIQQWNGLRGERIDIGQRLKIKK
jgi:membrane-bound lytic murein transglycosylase D